MPKPDQREERRGPSPRQLRVAEQVRHVLAAVFGREEFRDPALKGVQLTVTEVRASPDLRHMTAFVSALGRDPTAAEMAALRRLTPFLRRRLAEGVRLRYVPELHFEADVALSQAQRISEALRRPEVRRDLTPPEET